MLILAHWFMYICVWDGGRSGKCVYTCGCARMFVVTLCLYVCAHMYVYAQYEDVYMHSCTYAISLTQSIFMSVHVCTCAFPHASFESDVDANKLYMCMYISCMCMHIIHTHAHNIYIDRHTHLHRSKCRSVGIERVLVRC